MTPIPTKRRGLHIGMPLVEQFGLRTQFPSCALIDLRTTPSAGQAESPWNGRNQVSKSPAPAGCERRSKPTPFPTGGNQTTPMSSSCRIIRRHGRHRIDPGVPSVGNSLHSVSKLNYSNNFCIANPADWILVGVFNISLAVTSRDSTAAR